MASGSGGRSGGGRGGRSSRGNGRLRQSISTRAAARRNSAAWDRAFARAQSNIDSLGW